jgi:hypothetical protein
MSGVLEIGASLADESGVEPCTDGEDVAERERLVSWLAAVDRAGQVIARVVPGRGRRDTGRW